MEYATIDALRERHPAWRLLRAGNSTLILSFLGVFFVEGNRGACPASEVAAALDDHLHALNAEIPTERGEERYPEGGSILFGGLGGYRCSVSAAVLPAWR